MCDKALFDIICVFFVLLPLLAAAVSGQFGRASLGIASGTILSVGVAGTFIGNIQILARLDDPTALPAALSVSLLTSLYAALVKVVLDVVQSKKPAPAPVHPGPYGAVAAALCLVTFVCAIVLGTPVFTFVSALATALFVLGIALIALLGMGSGSRCIEGDIARFLPQVGLLILYASIVTVMPVLDDPSKIGPVMAWGLLGHFYCNVASLLIKLGLPHRIQERSDLADWLVFAASLFGVGLHMVLTVWAIS